jgi:hypothetical protein
VPTGMFRVGIVVCGDKGSLAIVEPKHGVDRSRAPGGSGFVAEVGPQMQLSLLREIDPEVLGSVNIYLLRTKGW